MPSTPRHISASAANAILLLAMASFGSTLPTMTYVGCFSSSQPLKDLGEYTYQTSGYCQQQCVPKNQAVLGLSDGSHCWCGDEIPAKSSKVSDSQCNSPCDGYDQDNCGGNGFYSVWLTGLESSAPYYGGSSGSSSSNPSSSSAPSTTTAAPSVVTSVSPGKTIVVTHAPLASSSSGSNSSSGGHSSTVGIAAGVVVGVVVIISAVAGLFFWLRHRRRRAAEDEYKRTQAVDFLRNGAERKPPPSTGYSNMSDPRLDFEAGHRRNSQGSIADDADFSRRILRVANPDRHSAFKRDTMG